MKTHALITAGILALALAAPAGAVEVKVADPSPNGVFTDGQGNQGYVEVDTDERAIRACNENEGTPAGDSLSGYVYASQNGETPQNGPTYGTANIGAADTDGEGVDDGDDTNGTEGDDCP